MPAIKLLLSGNREDFDVVSIIRNLTEMTCNILKKYENQTMVILEFVERDSWFIGTQSLVSLEKNSFKVDVTITDQTCTKEQKKLYMKEVFNFLKEHISQLHEHSNIHIIDCKGDSYGYGGKTQDYIYYNKE